jgi:radical SAM superfamily enzyme YgiQ (UPF0313 family)
MRIKLVLPSLVNPKGVPVRGAPMPNMTLFYLAGMVPPHHSVSVVDERVGPIDFDDPVDLVGISVMTHTARHAYEVADRFRRQGVKVVLGGIHVTFAAQEAAAHADAVVVGEAEDAWPELIADVERGRLEPRYERPRRASLENLAHPRFDLIDRASYPRLPGMKSPAIPVITTRGCPHDCDFCSISRLYGRKIRFRPVGEVVDEVKLSGADVVFFADENFFINPRRTEELLDAVAPLKIRFRCQADATLYRYPELVERAAQVGLTTAFVGFESLSPESLRSVSKAFNRPEQYASCIQLLDRHGIACVASVIVGWENDGPRQVQETAEFLIRNRATLAYFWPLSAFPGTTLYDRLKESGRLAADDWWLLDYTDPRFIDHIRRSDSVSAYDLHQRGMRAFYSASAIARRCLLGSGDRIMRLAFNVMVRRNFEKYGIVLT